MTSIRPNYGARGPQRSGGGQGQRPPGTGGRLDRRG